MNCELVRSQLAALLDGELTADTAAAAEWHLAACPTCTQAHADLAAVREMAAAWEVDTPDISARIRQAIAAEDQSLLLDEVRGLRTEMEALRAEVVALRRQLSRPELPRTEGAWTPPSRENAKDYSRMENDPWNLIRS